MKRRSSFKRLITGGLGLAVIATASFMLSIGLATGSDTKQPNEPVPPKATTPAEETGKKTEKKRLSGAALYATHCGRCHAERFVTERTAAQWKTIMLHMRVRANLPATQAKEVLKYLQDGSGNP